MGLNITRDQASLEFRLAADTLDALFDTVEAFLATINQPPPPPDGPDTLTAAVDYIDVVRAHLATLEARYAAVVAAANAASQHKSRTTLANTYSTRRTTLFPERAATPATTTTGDDQHNPHDEGRHPA